MKIDPRIAMTLRQIMLMNFGFFGIQYSSACSNPPSRRCSAFSMPIPGSIPLFAHGRPRYRPDCAADYRRFERPHLVSGLGGGGLIF